MRIEELLMKELKQEWSKKGKTDRKESSPDFFQSNLYGIELDDISGRNSNTALLEGKI